MVYRHLFYAFAARPPFEVVAAGAPFALPQPAAAAASATVQFAAGLALDEAAAELLVTYGVLDCGMHATRVALGRVLEELGVGCSPEISVLPLQPLTEPCLRSSSTKLPR